MQSVQANEPPPDGEDEEGHGLSPAELALFALRATRKHILLAVTAGLVIATIGLSIVSCIPPVYDATCKIFIQDSVGLTSSLTAGRTMTGRFEGAKALDEFILARDNLTAIVREARLFDTWPRTRPLVMRIKDRIFEAAFGPPSRRDMERGFVEMLAGSISAAKDGESIRIHGKWREPQNAYEITRLVERNFLAARAAYELGPIQRAIPFLEAELADAEREVEDALVSIQQAQEPVAPPARPTDLASPAGSADAPRSAAHSVELISASRELSDIRKKIRELVEPARARVAALKLELVELQASYSADHPKVLQQQAKIAAANESGAEVAKLKQRESELLGMLARLTGKPARTPSATSGEATATSQEPSYYDLYPLQAKLGGALRKTEDTSARLQTARIELATAEADFRHRYVVIEQAEVPGGPQKSKVPVFYAVSVLVAVLGAIGAGTLRELRRGRLVEAWQVRTLGLPLLGEVHLKRLPADGEKS